MTTKLVKLVRVRGGPKGFRMIPLDQWKDEQKAKRGKTPKKRSHRAERADIKRKRKRGKKKPQRKK